MKTLVVQAVDNSEYSVRMKHGPQGVLVRAGVLRWKAETILLSDAGVRQIADWCEVYLKERAEAVPEFSKQRPFVFS